MSTITIKEIYLLTPGHLRTEFELENILTFNKTENTLSVTNRWKEKLSFSIDEVIHESLPLGKNTIEQVLFRLCEDKIFSVKLKKEDATMSQYELEKGSGYDTYIAGRP